MLAHLNLNKILFLDIETVPQYPNFDQVPDQEKKFFAKKQPINERMNSPQKLSTNERVFGLSLVK